MPSLRSTTSFSVKLNTELIESGYILIGLPFFVAVVGEKEKTSRTVNVRTRDNKVHGEFTIQQVIEKFKNLQQTRTNCEDTF
jgi:Anticodon binding domain